MRSPMTSESSAKSLPVLDLRYVEVRSAWGTNILDLDDGQLGTVRETLAEFGLKVSSIGSPIGKITIDDEFPPHLERMRHAVEVAHDSGGAVHQDLLLLHSRGHRPGQSA